LDTERPISFGVLEKLKEDLALEWTYNSNSIEGNSLTLAETRVVISDGMTIGGKSIREHFEALNHKKAIEYLETLIKPNYNLRAIDILNIHSLVLKNIDDNYAGRLRDGMVRIIGANFTPPSPNKVSDLLDELIEFVNINHAKYTAPVLATIFHHQFVWIHPFFDGNGRTVRLAMNLLLMKEGYPPAIILKNDRKKYYEALNQANNGKYDKLTLLMLQAIERSLNIYINVLPKNYVEYEPISNIVAEPDIPYGFEYISLLARTGKINAFKEGRNWVTSKKDVMEHFSKRNK
jgi:Fic family protein